MRQGRARNAPRVGSDRKYGLAAGGRTAEPLAMMYECRFPSKTNALDHAAEHNDLPLPREPDF